MSDPAAAARAPRSRAIPDELSPRHLAVRVAELVAVIAVVVIAINALPGLDEVKARLAAIENRRKMVDQKDASKPSLRRASNTDKNGNDSKTSDDDRPTLKRRDDSSSN